MLAEAKTWAITQPTLDEPSTILAIDRSEAIRRMVELGLKKPTEKL
jgi:hypothetical protein